MKDLKILTQFIIIYLLKLIVPTKEDNYISLEFHNVDDCIREVDFSNRMVFGFTPYDLSFCDPMYRDIYPHYFVKNEKYDFGTEIKFIFQDTVHFQGFMNITVHFNEYYITTTDRVFWKCLDCLTEDGNYYYDENKKLMKFYKIDDYATYEKNYTFIFKINNADEINKLITEKKFKVNHEYYAFTDKKIIYLKLYYTEDELELINFNTTENFHIKGNESLPFDSSQFYYHIDYINFEFNGNLSALDIYLSPLILKNNCNFKTSNKVGIRYKLAKSEISNRAVNVSIYLTAFNNNDEQVSTKTEFIFVISLYGDESDNSENLEDTSKDTIKDTIEETSKDIVKETTEESSKGTVKQINEVFSEDKVKDSIENSYEINGKNTDDFSDEINNEPRDDITDELKYSKKEECPINKYFLKSQKKCVDNCYSYPPFIYIYKDECVEKCPSDSNYSKNHICIIEDICEFYEECPKQYPYILLENKKCIKKCEPVDFFNNICKIQNNKPEVVNDMINKIKKSLLEGPLNSLVSNDFSGLILNENDIIYSITTEKAQNINNDIHFISFLPFFTFILP